MIAFRTGIAVPFVSAALLLCVLSCQSTAPEPLGKGVESHGLEKLLEKNPVDVAVAPVRGAAGKDAPMKDLRVCFQKALVTRRYSPLANEFVDRHVADAAYPSGSSNEQAVMTIDVERWDTSLWKTLGAISVRMQVRLTDAASGEELWSGRVDQRYDMSAAIQNLPTETARMHYACERIAAEILEKLPARNTVSGP